MKKYYLIRNERDFMLALSKVKCSYKYRRYNFYLEFAQSAHGKTTFGVCLEGDGYWGSNPPIEECISFINFKDYEKILANS